MNPTGSLRTAVKAGNVESILKVLDEGIDVNKRNEQRETVLFAALYSNVEKNQLKSIINLLLEVGVNPQLKDQLGNSPIGIAGIHKYGEEIIPILLEYGAEIDDLYEETSAYGDEVLLRLSHFFQSGLSAKNQRQWNQIRLKAMFNHENPLKI